jgi:methionyl-tRNA formyltransferase
MKVVFFGTPEFAARTLKKILSSDHDIVAAVCGSDSRKGRGRKEAFPEVKQVALERGLKLLQPGNLKDRNFITQLENLNADFFCVVAFRILPEDVFEIPPRGCVNLHASLLPRYRGAAPINWALINGEEETGLTAFFIRRKVDTGDIIMQRRIKIDPEETFGELHDRMADLGGDLLIETMNKIESGEFEMTRQDDSRATAAPKITPELGRIDWSKPAEKIHNLVRGLSPRPAAYTFFNGTKMTIIRTRPADKPLHGKPGAVLFADAAKGLIVSCGSGALELLEVKPESRGVMNGAEFVRGKRIAAGAMFGE